MDNKVKDSNVDNDNEEEEKTVLDYLQNLKAVWPFSLLFPNDITDQQVVPSFNDKDDDEVNLSNNITKIIGRNINEGVDYGLGMLHFILKYSVNDEVLKIIMIEATNLVGKDPRGTSDPYAVISFEPRLKVEEFKTKPKMKTLNPIWNHIFSFHKITDDVLLKYKVRIVVYDWDNYGSHEPLGEILYDLHKLLKKEIPMDQNDNKDLFTRWIKELDSKYDFDGKYEGDNDIDSDSDDDNDDKLSLISQSAINEMDEEIVKKSVSQVAVSVYSDEEEEEEREDLAIETEDNEDDQDLSKTVNIVRRIEIKKFLQALENSRHAYGELLISLNYSVKTRRLIVVIVKAKNMIDPSRRSLVPYCTLRHLLVKKDREQTKSMHKTSYRFYSINPVWNEEFQLSAAPDKLKMTAVEIQVFSSTKSTKPKDELLGVIRLGLKAYPNQKKHWEKFLQNIGKPISDWHVIRQ